jgi:hypothetical protein
MSEFVREEMQFCAELIHQDEDPEAHGLTVEQMCGMRWALQDPLCNPLTWKPPHRKVMARYLQGRYLTYVDQARFAGGDGDMEAAKAFDRDAKKLRKWVNQLRKGT